MREAILDFLEVVIKNHTDGEFNLQQTITVRKATQQLEKKLTGIINDTSVYAIDQAKKAKAADFQPYLAEVQRLLVARGIPLAAAKEVTQLPRMVPIFGGGLDKQILDSVWNKVWPDALNVDDRVKRLSQKARIFTELTIKQGVSEGKSAANIAKELRQHFLVEGMERKAAFRLAAHTTNMCYEAAQAEISIQAAFVTGVRIRRGVHGRISKNCQICLEHGGLDHKDYYKEAFGGQDVDMWVMANAPAYHTHCNCGVETIYEDAVQFIENARKGTSVQSVRGKWEVNGKDFSQLPHEEREKYLKEMFGNR